MAVATVYGTIFSAKKIWLFRKKDDKSMQRFRLSKRLEGIGAIAHLSFKNIRAVLYNFEALIPLFLTKMLFKLLIIWFAGSFSKETTTR